MSANMSKKQDTNPKNQRIQVFARCRPLNKLEKKQCSPSVVEVIPEKKIIVKDKNSSREFFFDKVFSPNANQIAVYKTVVAPLIQEVLNGYNCTVFAYGQTGTGKTYTMEGERSDSKCSWDDDPGAGIIPRSLHQLFEELNKEENVEYSVRVSFLELYNEELFDLLSSTELSRLRLFEDSAKKGSVIIQGLGEIMVNSKDEVYAILEKGTARRQTGATMLNATSSRSHTVFSVTVHIKENTIDGEELLKTGKLNLVDLAGSENVGRSGAVDKRAREAGNINQSLLTLGRVITALIEKQPHVPYRESKLTRLLQDSLGGHTKTSIIATVSPALCNIDETLSTLDYATKAKSITIKPEVNQKTTKRALIREYTEEIERLRKDLVAQRSKEGIYVDSENYNNLMSDIERKTERIKELSDKLDILKEETAVIEQLFATTREELEKRTQQLDETVKKYDKTASELIQKTDRLNITRKILSERTLQRDEKEYIVNVQNNTEKKLTQQAELLLSIADKTTDDVSKLHAKIDRKHLVEKTNEEKLQNFHSTHQKRFVKLDEIVANTENDQVENLGFLSKDLEALKCGLKDQQLQTSSFLDDIVHYCTSSMLNLVPIIKSEAEQLIERENSLCLDIESKMLESQKKQDSFMNEKFPALVSQINTVNSAMIDWILLVHKQLQEKVERHKNILNQRAKEQITSLNTIKDSIQVFHQQEKEALDKFKEMSSETSAEQDGLHKELGQILHAVSALYKKHSETKETISKRHQETFDSLTKPGTIVNQCEKLLSLHSHEAEESIGNDNAFLESISRAMDMDEFANKKQSILEEQRRMSSEVTMCWEENREINKDNLEEIKKEFEHCCSTISQNVVTTEQNIQAVTSKVKQKKKRLQIILEDQGENLLTISSKSSNVVLDLENRLKTATISLKDEILKQDIELEKLISEDLVKDVPTGTTPQRKNYIYPRIFAATSPYSRLVERFHSQLSVNVIPSLPVDTSFDELEEIKRSPPVLDLESVSPEENELLESDCGSSMSDTSVDSVKNKENCIRRKKVSRLPKKCKAPKVFLRPPTPVERKPLSATNTDTFENISAME